MTHDYPAMLPTAGYLAAEHVRLQHRPGLLDRAAGRGAGQRRTRPAQRTWRRCERGSGRGRAHHWEDIVEALHRYLVATPARVLCAALTDAVGDRRTQNQPGTSTEYLNWKILLSKPDGDPLTLEDLYQDERTWAWPAIFDYFPASLASTSGLASP